MYHPIMFTQVVFEACILVLGNGMHRFSIMARKSFESMVVDDFQYLGSYSSEEEAARAYDIAAKRYHGSKAVLNFQSSEEGISRNPFQMNSKPTSRRVSVMSTGDEYGESGMEYMSDLRDNDVDMENRQQEMHIGRNCPDM